MVVSGGAVLFNSGTIIGGDGGGGGLFEKKGHDGNGVILDGGTIVDSGQIDGGIGGNTLGSAILFGKQASTLFIQPTAFFVGAVIANSTADDTLILSGTGGALIGIGREFVGFTTIEEEQSAAWVLTGTNTIATTTSLVVGGALQASEKLVDNGSIVVTKTGQLTLDGTITGIGAIQIDAGSSLVVDSSFTGPSLDFGAGRHGTLSLGANVTLGSTISGFSAGDTIQLALHATSLSYASGTLTLDSGYKAIEKLSLDGSYTTADFHLTHAGTSSDPITDITGVATTSTAPTVLPDFASAIPQTAAAEVPVNTDGGAGLLDRASWPDWDLLSPLHGLAR